MDAGPVICDVGLRIMMPPDFIEYFRALVERNPTAEPWVSWWEAHKAQVAMLVPPGVYLRLTYTPHVELYAILEAAGFHYPRPRHYRHPKFHHPHPVPAAWLKKRIDLPELEKKLSSELSENDLTAIREGLQPGDEI